VLPVRRLARRAGGGAYVLVGEAERDDPADPAAVRRRLQHLLARVSHVASRVDARHCGGARVVDDEDLAEPARVGFWS